MADLAVRRDSGEEALSLPPNAPQDEKLSPKEKYEYLTEYGTQILCMIDPETGCSYLSRNFEAITGNFEPSCMGAGFYDIVHEDFRERLQQLLITQPERNKPVAYRCKLRHADEKWYWYLFLIHGKHQPDAQEVVCVLENVHESIQIQGNLQKAKLEAELALRARSEFLANMSHDLRTPLNAVIGFAQMMDSEMFGPLGSPQYSEYVKHIQESGYDLLTKIEDLLEISNIDAGRVTLEREEVFLGDIIKQVMDTQLHHASGAGVRLAFTPMQPDLRLNVDRVKLQHILGHLLSNAIKHSDEGRVVSIEAGISETGGLALRVCDQGDGMPKAKLNALISALQEDNCWTAKSNHGIGLGLALTKEFVSLHGGEVHLTSEPGMGTTVHILLPAECLCERFPQPEYLRQMAI